MSEHIFYSNQPKIPVQVYVSRGDRPTVLTSMKFPFFGRTKGKKMSKTVKRVVAGVIIGGAIASIVGKTLMEERKKEIGGGGDDDE